MKISDFCKIFHLSEYTVRFYVKKGLLLPIVHNKQYIFTEECINDMNIIIEFKDYMFSLDEIHNYLSLKRISNFASKEDKLKQNLFFQKKRDELLIKEEKSKKVFNELHEFEIELEKIENE